MTRKKQTEQERYLYNTVYDNAIFFLKKGILEITSHNDYKDSPLAKECALISCLFIQTSIELSVKAFFIQSQGIKSILKGKYKGKRFQDMTELEIFNLFQDNIAQTKGYNDLIKILENNPTLIGFTEDHFGQIRQFQSFRNNLVHFNLSLAEANLYDLKYELIFAIVHLIVPLLTEISYDYETPNDFYIQALGAGKPHENDIYKKLINFGPYTNAMEEIAKKFTGYAYLCLECGKRTYSPENHKCYSCNLDFEYAAGYVDCPYCKAKKAIVYDINNIALNNNQLNGSCLNCERKPIIFKCIECNEAYAFFNYKELKECKPEKCYYR